MGGLALKNLSKEREVRRYEKKEFFELSARLLPIINKLFETETELVLSYHNKETFGDMDILLYDKGFEEDVIINLINELNPGEIYNTKNSNVFSFDYENLQIDLIFIKPEEWESSKIFYKWGDLGNFMGKLFQSYGNFPNRGHDDGFVFKYGFDGIKVNMFYKTHKKVLYLSRDNRKAFEFLGLDFDKHIEGFKDQFEVFEYIINSKFFSYDIFQWENLSSINIDRNKRRSSYIKFLEYIEGYKNTIIEYKEDYEFYLEYLSNFFGIDIIGEYKKLENEVENIKSVKNKFSGRHVMKELNLKGKEISDSMSSFRNHIEHDLEMDYNKFILDNDFEYLMNIFKENYGK